MLWSAQFGIGSTQSYRAFRSNWTAYPTTNPNISISNNATTNAYDVYVSWNGATEVKLWHMYHGPSNDGTNLAWIQSANRTGFETYMSVPLSSTGTDGYFQVVAADNGNRTLGYTDFIAANGGGRSPASAAESTSIVSQSASQTSGPTPVSTSGAATRLLSLEMGYGVVTTWLVLPLGSVFGAFVVI